MGNSPQDTLKASMSHLCVPVALVLGDSAGWEDTVSRDMAHLPEATGTSSHPDAPDKTLTSSAALTAPLQANVLMLPEGSLPAFSRKDLGLAFSSSWGHKSIKGDGEACQLLEGRARRQGMTGMEEVSFCSSCRMAEATNEETVWRPSTYLSVSLGTWRNWGI